jgi:hypothetical protein
MCCPEDDPTIETAPGAGGEGDANRSPASSMPSIAPAPSKSMPEQGTAIGGSETETSQPFGPTTGISNPIPIPKKQQEWEGGYQNEHGPRPSRWESFVAAPFMKGAHVTIASPWGGALERMAQESDAASGKILSPDQASKLYPGRPVPYTTPVDQGTAYQEFNDRLKQQQLSDWAGQRPQTTMGRVMSTAAGFVGGLTDPLNFAVGAMAGGVAEIAAPEGAPLAMKAITHYLANLGGFSATDAMQNLLEHQMGAKQKQLPEIIGENAVPAAIMTGIGMGLGAMTRRFSNEAGGTSEADIPGIKKTVAAFESDQKVPQLEDQRNLLAERKAGVSQPGGPNGEKITPTLLTSPLQETQLYAAAHADGTPLVHEHGLGPGTQFTDSHEVANNGVSRSTETPGQVGETKLPEGTKLLDIDRPAAEDYHSENSLLKKIEEKTGIPLDSAIKNGESLKDVITNLGDWSGAEIGDGKTVPEDILKQVQDIAKEQGYNGYQFTGSTPEGEITNRQAHMFDTSGMTIDKAYPADPNTTPQMPTPADAQQEMQGAQPAQTQNPALDKAQSKFYSPEIEKLIHDFRKGKVFDPYSPEELANTQKDIEQYKQQLADLAKSSDSASDALDKLKTQEVQDKRLADIAKRIAECGQGGGV